MKKRISFKLFVAVMAFLFFISGMSGLAVSEQNPTTTGTVYKNLYEKVLAEDDFLYGIDYPWFISYDSIGCNLGANYAMPSKSHCSFNEQLIYQDLFNIKALGFNAVNFWLFTWLDGIMFDDNGNVLGLDDCFLDNL